MKDEIKEILDNTLEYLEGIDETRNTKILTTNETNILLDYITNLQEENKKLKNTLKKASKETQKQLKGAISQEYTDLRKILNILQGSDNNE